MGNGAPNTALKFFPQETLYRLNESQKTSCGAHFPHISGSIGPIVSKKKKIRFTRMWTHTKHVNFMKISSKFHPAS